MRKKAKYVVSKENILAAVRGAVTDSLFMPLVFEEKHEIRLKPKFNTACWTFRPPHYIFIGEDLFNKPILRDGLNEEDLEKYVANHYHHEMGHALFTERNFKVLKKILAQSDIPWSLFNLCEDARIENLYRTRNGYSFQWTLIEKTDFSLTERPEPLLFALIQAEGDIEYVKRELDTFDFMGAASKALFPISPEEIEKLRKGQKLTVERIYRYYWPKILDAKNSLGLVPIMLEWLQEFGQPPAKPQSGGSGSGAGEGLDDVELSAELAENDNAFEEFSEETSTVDATKSESDNDKKGKGKNKLGCNPDYEAEAQQGKVLPDSVYAVDTVRAEALAKRMSKVFEDYVRMTSSRVPQRRISARHAVIGRPIYRKKTVLGRARKRILLIMDTSGSMYGFHSAEGRILLAALSTLAKKGYVEGHVVFSGVTRQPSWERYSLPLSHSVIERFEGHLGSEGLEYALQGNLDLAQQADLVMVYTDAQICDRPIDKVGLHKRGIFTWGLYAGEDKDCLEELERYFDRAIIRDTIEKVIDAMLVQI